MPASSVDIGSGWYTENGNTGRKDCLRIEPSVAYVCITVTFYLIDFHSFESQTHVHLERERERTRRAKVFLYFILQISVTGRAVGSQNLKLKTGSQLWVYSSDYLSLT